MSLFRGSEDSGNREFGGRDGMGGTVKTGKQALVQIQQSPNRPLYIMIWSRALFKAHWSFWVPNLEGIRTNGKRAHVEGDVRGGFHLEFMRNYDIAQTTSQPTIIEIGAMRVEDLLDTPLGGQRLKENVPRDQFEIVAASITAPQGSLNRVNEQPCTSEASQRTFQNAGPVYPSPSRSTDQRQPPPRRVVVQDCQYWVKQVVEALVTNGLLIAPERGVHAGRDPREILAALPKH